jgi:hypothetical protein
MRSTVSCVRALVLFSVGVLFIGCGSRPQLEPVEGTVLHKGKAIAGVLVTFHPKKGDPVTALRPTGLTDAEGKFVLMTGQDKGAPAGDYTITFLWSIEVNPKKDPKKIDMNMSVETKDGFDGAYMDYKNSRFKAEVKRGDNKLEPFRLE